MDRLSGLAAFIRTVELGSQAAAAKALGLSRVAIGRQIQGLEQQLGVRLLQRTTRSQTLTEAGTAFFERARPALDQLQEAAEQAAEFRTSLRGSLRINAPISFAAHSLAPVLAGFSARYPELEIELTLNDRAVDLIGEGYDLALRVGEVKDINLASRKLAQFPVIPCAAPSYLARHGTPLEPADLLAHNCLRYLLSSQSQGWLLVAADGTRHTIPVRGNMAANNGDTLMAAALAGQGIILQPSFIVGEALRDGRLVQLFPGWQNRHLVLHAVFPATRMMPIKLRRLVDFLVEAYRKA
ncbi:LysR family transcriptional regulator [Acetobacteraceae bacterium H6797]|nr:LysR family transcriptional regulator [Acetobacteraceae bacterium H6797]